MWGIQAHSEINIANGTALLKGLIVLNLKTNPFFVNGLKSTPRDSGIINLIIRNFISSIDFRHTNGSFLR